MPFTQQSLLNKNSMARANGIRKITHSCCSHPLLPNRWPINTAKAFLDNEHSIIMEGGDEKNTWMGDYFALIGDGVLHFNNRDTHCKLAFHMISHGNHNNGSRMLCQYLETVVDKELKRWLPDDTTDDEKFHASLFPAVAPLYAELGKSFLNISTYTELQWSLVDINNQTGLETFREICEHAFHNLEKARAITAGIVLDGVAFLEEYGIPPHQYTDEQKMRMTQNLATIHQHLG